MNLINKLVNAMGASAHNQWAKNYYETRIITAEDGTVAAICFDHFNKRVRLDDAAGNATTQLLLLSQAATEIHAEKCIAKIRPHDLAIWLANGYVVEGIWDAYFNGDDALGVSRYLQPARRNHASWTQEDEIIQTIQKRIASPRKSIQAPFTTRACTINDAEPLSHLYAQVFPFYPTPIQDAAYVRWRLSDGARIRAIWNAQNELVSAATLEIDAKLQNAELTDCATLPAYRGYGWMRELIDALHQDAVDLELKSIYALCRAGIPAINANVFDMGYVYRGRFANNCRMESGYENMNLWIKKL